MQTGGHTEPAAHATAPDVFGAPYPLYDAPTFADFGELVASLDTPDVRDLPAFERMGAIPGEVGGPGGTRASGETNGGRTSGNATVTYGELSRLIARSRDELNASGTGHLVPIVPTDPQEFAVQYLATVSSGRCAVLCSGSERFSPADIPGEVRTIVASSGTSGTPKPVMLTERGILDDLAAGLRTYEFTQRGRYGALLPRAHAFGLTCDTLAPLVTQGTICIPSAPTAFFAELPRMRTTALNVPPRAAAVLLQLLGPTPGDGRYRVPTLRKLLCGGAGTSARLAQGLRAHGIEAFGCYGLSECSPCVAVNRDGWRKDGSCGVVLDCNELAFSDTGEILVRGTNVTAGYLGMPDETARALCDGWFHTGDLGHLDEDGFLYVDGRADDVIVLADGRNVAPEPLERRIEMHPAVAEARVEAAETGGPGGTACTGLRALVVLREDASTTASPRDARHEVARWVRGLGGLGGPDGPGELAGNDVPVIEQVVFEERPLPRTPTGKLRRRA